MSSYELLVMNGCVLADYLRFRYPDLKIIPHSTAVEIQESEMGSIDAYIPKGEGVARLVDVILLVAHDRAVALHGVGREACLRARA